MNDVSGSHELGEFLVRHLDPLDDHAVKGRKPGSDFDLTPGGWSGVPVDKLTPAAVLIGLIDRPAGLTVLLTRRSDTLRNHTGQVALPGGRQDPGETPVQTAVRVDRVSREDGKGEALKFLTNVGDEVEAGPDNPIRVDIAADGEPRPYLHVRRGLEALIARPVFYELVEMAQERDTAQGPTLGVSSNGAWFPVGPAGAHAP